MLTENQSGYHPLRYSSKKEVAQQVWNSLIKEEAEFYKKHGYLDVVYDKEKNTYLRKKAVGRPISIKRKENRITIRLDDELFNALDKYCRDKNLEKTEAIRCAIEKMCLESLNNR